MQSHAEVRFRAGPRLIRELGDEEPEGNDGHDPGQDHGDPLARLDTGLEGAKNKLEEEEGDERRRRLVDLERLDPEAADEAREVEVAYRVAPGVLARVAAWKSTGPRRWRGAGAVDLHDPPEV